MLLSSASDNTISGNTVNYNRTTGVDITGTSTIPSTNNTLNNNTVNHNGSSGIRLGSYSSNNTLGNNTANSNTYDGILIPTFSSTNHNVSNNTTSYNGRYGIGISGGNNNTVSGNTSESNTKHGIYLNSNSGNDIFDNICRSNNEYGIYLGWGSNTIRGNLIENNTSYGIYITSDGTPDLGGVGSGNEGRSTIRNNDAGNYQVYNNTANTIYAHLNYWVYAYFDDIDNHIYDDEESGSAMGSVLFTPWLENDQSLPVELSSFKAHQEKSVIILEWRTESEIDNLGFIIDRRVNQGNWVEIASYLYCKELEGAGSKSSATEYKFIDKNVIPGMTYEYRLSDVSYYGEVERHSIRKIAIKKENLDVISETFTLYDAYPNPFNPVTTITYQIAEPSFIRLSIYDINGRLIETLVNEHKNAGYYTVNWNAQNIVSGIYIYRIDAGEFSSVKKCLVVK